MKEYDEGAMADSRGTFNGYAIELRNIASDRRGVEYLCWMVAAPFCAMRYIYKA